MKIGFGFMKTGNKNNCPTTITLLGEVVYHVSPHMRVDACYGNMMNFLLVGPTIFRKRIKKKNVENHLTE